jgi:Tfp pilus assembly protein FimT
VSAEAGGGRDAMRRTAARALPRDHGFTVVGLLVTLAVVAIVAGMGVPELFRATAQARLELGAAEIASILRLARVYALRH